jgi:hypothetical protein
MSAVSFIRSRDLNHRESKAYFVGLVEGRVCNDSTGQSL